MHGATKLRRSVIVVGTALVALFSLSAGQVALATFGGASGVIAYRGVLDPNTPTSRTAIFLSGSGALTQPRPGSPPASAPDHDFTPAWSPDGKQVAFTRLDQLLQDYLIEIVDRDGTNLRQLVSSDAFDQGSPPGFENAQIFSPAWSADGERIVFVVRHPGRPFNDGLWTIGVDGTGLQQLLPDAFADQPEWAPAGSEIAYRCRFRGVNVLRQDLCVVDAANGVIQMLSIDVPGAIDNPAASRPKWTPDGDKLMFTVSYSILENSHSVQRNEIFTMNPDGTGLKELTHAPDACPGQNQGVSRGSVLYFDLSPSPDGELIVATGSRTVVTASDPVSHQCSYTFDDNGLWTLPAGGGTGSLFVADNFASQPDWQPVPADLKVFVDDGHSNPLKGLKVELRTEDGDVVDDRPIHTAGGSYAFETVAPGDYRVRVTLIDASGGPLAVPSFDIRHEAEFDDPVWIERSFTLQPNEIGKVVPVHFAETPQLAATSVADEADRDRLDDMANIYFRVRQFVDWVKLTLTPTTGPTAEFYAFAESVGPNDALYLDDQIFLGTAFSLYEVRDGVFSEGTGDEAPENGEWHEFVHHLYHHFILAGPPCTGTNHGGYANPDTCDSMSEGLAAFLPTLASQSIEGAVDSEYDGLYNLEPYGKAWTPRASSSGRIRSGEDLALAALLWDLVDGNADDEITLIVGQNGQHFLTTYTDQTSMTIRQLWDLLTTARPRTVLDLRASLGRPALTLDPDHDGTPDLATVDQVFLMHGFFPIDIEQAALTTTHTTYHYDVNYAQRANPSADRNAAVGASAHRVFNADGTVKDVFIPRANTPHADNANLELHVVDASGTPLSGAEVSLQIQYPGLQQTVVRRLGSGDGSLMYLELPPHFDFLLPDDAPFPACNPATDLHVQVTLTTRVNGFTSIDSHTFDNCTYLLAVEAATGPAALAFTTTFPEDAMPPVSTVAASASVPPIGGNTTGVWTVELACDDPVDGGFAAGCARSEYGIDGGPFTLYTTPVEIDEVGQHTFAFRSVDAAENAEATRSIQLGVTNEPDSDGDGLGDFTEAALGTDPNDPDTDDDGLSDGNEVAFGTNPLNSDSDNDNLADGAEVALGTDPLDADTDRDGLADGAEVAGGSNPLDADTDDDGLGDGADNCTVLANVGQENYEGDALGDVCDSDDDNDGAADTQDLFPRSDLHATVVIGSCDSGVPNQSVAGGANMNDEIGQCSQTTTTQRAFERCVQRRAGEWQRMRLIRSAQKKAILNCASQPAVHSLELRSAATPAPSPGREVLRALDLGVGDVPAAVADSLDPLPFVVARLARQGMLGIASVVPVSSGGSRDWGSIPRASSRAIPSALGAGEDAV